MTTTGGGAVDEGASPEERLAAMGLGAIRLPVFGAFVPAVRTGDLLHLMGHWPLRGGQPVTGRVGEDLSLDDGLEAARLAALAVVGTLVDELHDLARVRRIASVLMVVNATADFDQHTTVADALGAAGGHLRRLCRHAALAVGVSSLPARLALELTAVVEVAD